MSKKNLQGSNLKELIKNMPSTNFNEWPDLPKLIDIGRKSGFVNIQNRTKIWPLLLELNLEKLLQQTYKWKQDNDRHSQDYDQLKKDAMRSFYSINFFANIDEQYLRKKQSELLQLLDALAKNQPDYKYFQGFHDVATIFIGLFGADIAYHMSHRIATTYLRDPFLFKFEDTVSILDKLIYELVIKQDKKFKQIFQQFEDKKLSFTMPWIITWFAHSFQDIQIITRIWDYLISSKASAIVYLSTALILLSKQDLLRYCQEQNVGFDIGIIHSYYQNLRKATIEIDKVIQYSIKLQNQLPLEKLPSYRQLNNQTVIKEENFLKQSKIHEVLQKKKQKQKKIKRQIYGIALILLLFGLYFGLHQSFLFQAPDTL